MNRKPKQSDLLRRTKGFTAYRAANGCVRIVANQRATEARSRTIQPRTWEQLNAMSDESFDGSCVFDLGIGVFRNKEFK